MSVLSLFSYFFSPIQSIYKSLRTHDTGEVFLSNEVRSKIENAEPADKTRLLKELYDIS